MTSAKVKAVFLAWLFLTTLIWGSSAAAAEFQWEQVALSLEFQEDEAVERILRFDPQWNWDWLTLDLSGRFYLEPVADKYSKLVAALSFPKIDNDWGLALGYQWNDHYRIYSSALGYSGDWWHDARLGFTAKLDTRQAAPDWDDQYRYSQDQERLNYSYPWNNWEYQLNFSRIAKQYPEAETYSSTKLALDQTVNWQSSSGFQLGLGYQEDTGDYPNDEYMRYDYWKETWRLSLKSSRPGRWHWSSEYSLQDWLQGLDPYRWARRFQLRCQSERHFQPRWGFKLNLAKLDYYSEELYYDPDEELPEEEEDLQSRVECRAALEAEWHRGDWRWGGEFFWNDYNYQSRLREDIKLGGCSVWGRWTGQPFTIYFELAPNGNLGHRDGFYKLELVYQP